MVSISMQLKIMKLINYLAIVSKSRLFLALQSSIMMCGGLPSRLEAVQEFKLASEVVEVCTSTPNLSQAHLMAFEACDCLAKPR